MWYNKKVQTAPIEERHDNMLRDDPVLTGLPTLSILKELAEPSSDGRFTYYMSTQGGPKIPHRAVVQKGLCVTPRASGSSVSLKFLAELAPERIVNAIVEADYSAAGEMNYGELTVDRKTLRSKPHPLFPEVRTNSGA